MPAFSARSNEPAVRLAQRLAGSDETTLVAFGTEAGLFQRAGMSTVVCGPGSIQQAHQADEYVSLPQLARCEAFLRGIGREAIIAAGSETAIEAGSAPAAPNA